MCASRMAASPYEHLRVVDADRPLNDATNVVHGSWMPDQKIESGGVQPEIVDDDDLARVRFAQREITVIRASPAVEIKTGQAVPLLVSARIRIPNKRLRCGVKRLRYPLRQQLGDMDVPLQIKQIPFTVVHKESPDWEQANGDASWNPMDTGQAQATANFEL